MLLYSDIAELQKIAKPETCSYTRLRGCYVNGEKDRVTSMNKVFLNLENEEYFKYLKIAKDVLSKKIDDNMLSMEFTEGEQALGDTKFALKKMAESGLTNEDAVEELYETIIEEFPHVGNYLILLYADTYDIPRVGTDGEEQDESEDIYKYVLCAICPVNLTAAGLGYNAKNNQIESRQRDWVVGKPVAGFIYPAFEERTVEEDKIMFYTSTPEEPPHDFMERGLKCEPVRTATEIRNVFEDLFYSATDSKELQEEFVILVNQKLNLILTECDNPQRTLGSVELRDICQAAGISEMYAMKIAKGFAREFPQEPKIAHLLSKSALKAGDEKEKKKKLTDMLREAADEIEKRAGETALTVNMKKAIGQYR